MSDSTTLKRFIVIVELCHEDGKLDLPRMALCGSEANIQVLEETAGCRREFMLQTTKVTRPSTLRSFMLKSYNAMVDERDKIKSAKVLCDYKKTKTEFAQERIKFASGGDVKVACTFFRTKPRVTHLLAAAYRAGRPSQGKFYSHGIAGRGHRGGFYPGRGNGLLAGGGPGQNSRRTGQDRSP